ncbi:MAG: ATP-binding protein [Deltaproteobacteria bacterium]|nr:MAG: ATP-binding protein [Deltaproteobacteria bacterium]
MNAQKVVIITGKGGVGKTTIAVNMAVLWAQEGWEVGLLDADIHSPNIPKMLGIKPQGIDGLVEGIEPASPMEGLKVVSMALFLHNQDTPITWRGPIKQGVIKQFISDSRWGELDFLIVDLPAGTGDEAISAVHFLKGVAGALIVTTPQALSLLEARRTASFFRQLHVPIIGLLENMVDFACPHCERALTPFGKGEGERVAKELTIPFLGRIPVEPEVAKCGDKGEPFVTTLPQSMAAIKLREIAQRCKALVEERVRFTLVTQILYK